jgi:HSP20 family protein
MARSLAPFVFDPGHTTSRGDSYRSLHREVNRLFDEVMRGTGPSGGGFAGSMMAPRMNVSETGQDFRIEVELPGVSEQDVHVELTDDLLTIRGEKRATREDAQHHVVERSFGNFVRSVRLPFAPVPDQVQAGFAHGVLTITLPKAAAEARIHRIPVQLGGRAGSQDTAAAVAGHPTPDTTRGATGQDGGEARPGQDGSGPGTPA